VSHNTLLVDIALALFVAIVLIVIAPGLAVVGLLAILVLLICAATFALDRWRKRRSADPLRELRRSRASAARSARGSQGQTARRNTATPPRRRPDRRPPRR
jgi:hypothetical protein